MASDGRAATPDGRVLEVVNAPVLDLTSVLSIIEDAPVGVVIVDGEMVVHVNSQGAHLTGLAAGDAVATGLLAMHHPWDATRYEDAIIAIRDAIPLRTHLRTSAERGGRTLDVRVIPVNGRCMVTISDATTEADRLREVDRFRAVADATSDLVGMAHVSGELLYINPAARRFHGFSLDMPVGEMVPFLGIAPDQVEMILRDGWPILKSGEVWEGEVDVVSAQTGESVPFWVVWVPTRNEVGEVEVISSTFRDLSERRRFEHRLAYAASHDPLTGLPNRERLFEVLAERAAARTPVAVLFCDLDDFKIVNDTLGHAVGDRVLRTIADRLIGVSRANDVVGRLGGDEFLVICDGVTSDNQAYDIAERISETIHSPIVINGREYRVTASIGISIRHGERATRAGDLVLEADIAMYRAKEAGRRHVEVFDSAMRTEMVERLDLERDLRLAIERGEIEVFFQPVMDASTLMIDGFESLVRWRHPVRGLLPPAVFLEVAEKAGLGVPLGDVILDQACRAAARFHAEDGEIQVGFNVSTSQMRSHDLPGRVRRVADAVGAPLHHLVLEVTEDIVMADVESARELLERIRNMGVRIAVDDFGTGYSSLSMLRRLPVDILKIDHSFVDGLGLEPGDTQIVRMVISLADELGLTTVAEGVETDGQAIELGRLGCVLCQGYYYAPPMTLSDALAFVRERNVSTRFRRPPG